MGAGRITAGATAGGVLATALHFTWLARIGRIDMPLTLTTGTAILGIYLRATRTTLPRISLQLLAYTATAAGILLKGPIGAVLPVAVVAAHLLVEGQLPPPWRIREWLRLIHEHGLWWGDRWCWPSRCRGSSGPTPPRTASYSGSSYSSITWKRGLGGPTLRSSPWWFYGPQFAVDFLPWSLLLPIAAIVCWCRGYWNTDPEVRLGAAWLLAVMFVLSCANFKRGDYLLPAFPGAALFLGAIFANEERRWREVGPTSHLGRPMSAAVPVRVGNDGRVAGARGARACRRRSRSATTAHSPPRSADGRRCPKKSCSSAPRPMPLRFTWAGRWPFW